MWRSRNDQIFTELSLTFPSASCSNVTHGLGALDRPLKQTVPEIYPLPAAA
jgi:hypothetical protein